MTQKTKLEIIGPYTPEHEGPFCTRDGRPVRIICTDVNNPYPIVAAIIETDGFEIVNSFTPKGEFYRSNYTDSRDLMNAREVPVAREFWVNEFKEWCASFRTPEEADEHSRGWPYFIRTIHVREVLPGEE